MSYGQTGNASIGNFASLGLYGAGSFNGRPGILPTQVANPDLKWERTTQINAGLDFGFFGDRVSGELDFYTKDTDDLLLSVNVPGTTGFSSILRNVGRLENRGVEFAVTGRVLDGRDLTWTTGFNISVNRNEITDLNEQVIEGGFINRAIEGQPIGVFYGYQYAGVDPANGDALYFVNETDADGNLVNPDATTNDPNEANRVVLGSPHPDFSGGFNNTVTYRGFELQMFWQFVSGNKVYDGGGRFKTANGDYFDNQLRDQLDRWQEPGDVTDVPEARLYFGNGTADSDRYLYDASYLRLKNLTFAYNVPTTLLNRFDIQGARLYVIGTNLLTFTKYPWWDPGGQRRLCSRKYRPGQRVLLGPAGAQHHHGHPVHVLIPPRGGRAVLPPARPYLKSHASNSLLLAARCRSARAHRLRQHARPRAAAVHQRRPRALYPPERPRRRHRRVRPR